MPFPGSASHAVIELRAGAATLLVITIILAGIALAASLGGGTSRAATRVLCAIPVASAVLGIVAVASGSLDLLTFILLLSSTAVILVLARVQARRLSRFIKAAQDDLRRVRPRRQQQRRTPPGSPRQFRPRAGSSPRGPP